MDPEDVWNPSAWCVYNQSVRTNNDVEGWHHRLNSHAGRAQLQFYLLLQLLHEEARLVNITVDLVREHELQHTQRRRYRQQQGRIFAAWTVFNADQTVGAAKILLGKCANFNQPRM